METYFPEFFIVVFSAVKFILAPPIAILHYEMGYWLAVLLTSIGGCGGILVFSHLSKAIINIFMELTIWLKIPGSKKSQKKFTYRNRLIVKIKRRYGLWGLVVLTPVFFSIPLGAFLAEHYYPKRNTLYWLFASVIGWSFILNGFFAIGHHFAH